MSRASESVIGSARALKYVLQASDDSMVCVCCRLMSLWCVLQASDVYKMDPDDDGPLVQTLAQANTLSLVLQASPAMCVEHAQPDMCK